MKIIKERKPIMKLLSFIFGLIIVWIIYIFIIAGLFCENGEPLTNKQAGIAFVSALLTMVSYIIGSDYNYLKRLELTTGSLLSNISVYKQREKQLLSKAEKIISKFLLHESDTHKTTAEKRSGNILKLSDNEKALSLNDIKLTIEAYPDLKSDKHISTLLTQLEESENSILNSKVLFNEYVTYLNSAIVSFPSILFTGFWKMKPMQFYVDAEVDEI